MEKGFFHGHTYSANPTSCTAALASIQLLKSKEIQRNIKVICASHEKFNARIKNHPKIKSTRQRGIIFALDLNVETERYGDLRYKLFDFYMNKGIYLRPLGNTVYILAPFIISKNQLEKIYIAIEEGLLTLDSNINTSVSVPTGKNAMLIGPTTVGAGATIDVAQGSTLVVV